MSFAERAGDVEGIRGLTVPANRPAWLGGYPPILPTDCMTSVDNPDGPTEGPSRSTMAFWTRRAADRRHTTLRRRPRPPCRSPAAPESGGDRSASDAVARARHGRRRTDEPAPALPR